MQDELIDRVNAQKRQSLMNFWKVSGEDRQWTEHLGSGVMCIAMYRHRMLQECFGAATW